MHHARADEAMLSAVDLLRVWPDQSDFVLFFQSSCLYHLLMFLEIVTTVCREMK